MPATITPIHPPAIPPERPANARTTDPSSSTRRRWAEQTRLMQAIDAARADGRAEGERAGHLQGWRWGLACGLVAGALACSLAWAAWLHIGVAP
jgi:hypothetical protein